MGRKLVLRDNNAKNGTFVNGQRIKQHRLAPGDEIQLGPNVRLLFSYALGVGDRVVQQRGSREQLLRERMYAERIESLANIVTGLAHQLNTPLGLATTTNALIASLAEDVRKTGPGPALDEILSELKVSTELMSRNLERANQLVRTFKQLSSRQLSDEFMECELSSVVRDCIATLEAELKNRSIVVATQWTDGAIYPWAGYPGHLSQVLINLAQNTLLHAYRLGESGKIDIALSSADKSYVLEFSDYGAGMPPQVLSRLFEPFVTSGRNASTAGLGLAIAHNIVTNILGGEIVCSSAPGKGTRIRLSIPRLCPRAEEDALGRSSITPERREES
jgi:signal transduction histidine kinase